MKKYLGQFSIGLFVSILGMFFICAGGLVRLGDFPGAKFAVPAVAGLIYWVFAYILLLPSRWVFSKTFYMGGFGVSLMVIAALITVVLVTTLTAYLMPDGWMQTYNNSNDLMVGTAVITVVGWIAASWEFLKGLKF